MIYLDNSATTRIDEEVLDSMLPFLKENYGNPSSNHEAGEISKNAIENSRKIIADSINANLNEIYFTSGGTESNNLALKGLFFENKNKKHIITTRIEHDCVLKTCNWLKSLGAEITYLDVDEEGFIDIEQLKNSIRNDTLVVSIIHANNEIGTIQNLEEIGKICKEKEVIFHTDACQSYTKIELDVEKMNLDLVTLNSHKIHGPKGVGALYIRKKVKITPLLHGGGHEKNIRSGTENVAGIVGFGKAVEIAIKQKNKNKEIEKLRDYVISELLKIPGTSINGPIKENRLQNNINVCLGNIEGESIAALLETENLTTSLSDSILVSTGSACASNTLSRSHVLKAIGKSHLESNSSIRISLSKYNTKQEMEYLVEKIKNVVEKLRKITPVKLES